MSDVISTTSLINLNPDSFVDLFEIYIDETIGIFRFHAGKNFNRNLIFRGNSYAPLPVDFSGFEFSADGKQNRPSIKLANVDGYITNYIKNKNDLINSKIKRIKVFVRNLDDINFSDEVNPFFGYRKKRNAVLGYGESFYEDNYLINKKTQENKFYIEFDLSSPLDLENQALPNRKISDNICSWNYRGKIPWSPKGEQKIFVSNSTVAKTESDIWGDKKNNEGVPVADENNKEFYSPNGYNLSQITYRGTYLKDIGTYNPGDFVKYIDSVNFDFFGGDTQFVEDNLSYSFYVCIKIHGSAYNGGNPGIKDPKLFPEYWIKDTCAKNLKACKLRWQNHGKGLPYGGFPGTRPFDYTV
jgi:lambda family phage minor tail protein L